MSAIRIEFRDGTVADFPEQIRTGGSWSNSVRYEGNFVIFKDVWGATTAYPIDLVAKSKHVKVSGEVMGMMELTEPQKNILKHIDTGGLLALCVYGKRIITTEIISRPQCKAAGIKSVSVLQAAGLLRYGDPSPYKSGKSLPLVLTDEGKAVMKQAKE